MFSSYDHLLGHHGDFARFRDAMIETTPGRFGPLWWGIWDQLVAPAADAHIVDLGTGPGLILPMLRARHPQARLTALEVQPVMLETARPHAEQAGARLVEADLADPLPLEAESADVVNATMVFHELEFAPPLLDEIARILKPGGTMVLYDWVKWPLRTYLSDQELTPELLQHFREHCLFSADDLAYLTERAGLEVAEVVGRKGGKFAVVVARKPL